MTSCDKTIKKDHIPDKGRGLRVATLFNNFK
ncbi:hypothetical protein SERP2546 [Staphylococcus epidermidis RP62A]|uniref:Uncharacterized protein n=1 Tax=Staphylococcus epidermidis (strain ATCC 35984 / DSM 28319 / BCRC 17069 / CCUG 31568 / BM 3577 / RP62A) TaxID=176279 RepID=Q5HK06_STAEQ|nr:hypothetical protein SERP2546 [Staphylococcus epidermidis RP62A]